jgi:hypothetical protein
MQQNLILQGTYNLKLLPLSSRNKYGAPDFGLYCLQRQPFSNKCFLNKPIEILI